MGPSLPVTSTVLYLTLAILVLAACLLFADARGSVAPAGLPAGATAGQLGGVAAASEPIGSRRVVDEQQRLEEWSGYAKARTEGRIVYVAGDGSGDFSCDGTDDQIEINQAIEYVAADEHLTTVHLKGPNTYVISDTIRVPSDTVLQGDATAVITVIPHQEAMWPPYKAMIECKGHGVRNITIRGFEILGNRASFSSDRHYYSVSLANAYDVTVSDLYIHDASGDGVKFEHTAQTFNGTTPDPAAGQWVRISDQDLAGFNQLHEQRGKRINSRFYNNRIESVGHDGIYIIDVDDFEVGDNYVYNCRTNSTVRLTACNAYSIHGNVLRGDPARGFSGNAGVQVQNGADPVDSVQIYGNEISRMALGGIVIYGTGGFGTQTGFHVHHNQISDCNIAGIRVFGAHNTLIQNNVLYGNHGDGIVYYYAYEPNPARKPGTPPEGERYTTFVRNNIIANSLPGPGPDSPWGTARRTVPVSGFGVNNCLTERHPGDDRPDLGLDDTHQFVIEHNCIYNNVSGPYNNASSETDIFEDPMFVDARNGDFHLQPGSPCIGAGTDGQSIGAY